MKNFSKILVVATAALALAFMAFAFVTWWGGPNWTVEAQAADLADYQFTAEQSADGNETWKVVDRISDETVVASAATLPDAIRQTRNKLKTDQQQRLNELNERITRRKAAIAEAVALQEVDLKAIALREQQLEQELAAVQAQILAASDQAAEQSREAQAQHRNLVRRREEIFRLRSQLAEVRAELYRAKHQQALLEDQLIRARGGIIRLENRSEQLQNSGATVSEDYEEP
ncbi:MAG: hypothetical protein ACREJB_12995 [Planctomycetaceae bacterium]